MLRRELQLDVPEKIQPLGGTIFANNLTYTEDQVVKLVDGANFRIDLGSHTSIVGASSSGKDETIRLIARLIFPSAGRLTIDNQNLGDVPEAVLGRRTAYVGPSAHVFSGTVMDNAVYGLKHAPLKPPEHDEEREKHRLRELKEAQASGTSADDVDADWIDYSAAGVDDAAQLSSRVFDVFRIAGLAEL